MNVQFPSSLAKKNTVMLSSTKEGRMKRLTLYKYEVPDIYLRKIILQKGNKKKFSRFAFCLLIGKYMLPKFELSSKLVKYKL